MKKLMKYLKGYEKETVLGPLFKLFEALLELFVPLIVASIIDRGIGGGDRGYIVKMCLLLVGLGALGLAASVTAQYFAARAAVGHAAAVRSALVSHIGKMSYSDLDRAGESSLITLMTNDVNQVQSGINLALRLLLRSPFIVFGAMIMAFFVDSSSALIFAATISALAVVVFGIMLATMPIYTKIQRSLEGVLGKTRENLTGARVIRAFCREEEENLEFDRRNRILTSAQKLAGRISSLMNPLTYVIVNIAIIVLLSDGSVRVDSGDLTQGDVVALYNYMTQISVELIKMASLIILLTKSAASARRISAELETPVGMSAPHAAPTGESASEYAVEFRGVSMKYPGAAANSLEGLSIAVRRGESIGVIGGTGSGKTTLVNLIPRFYDATEGEVLVDGINVKDYPTDVLRSKIGVVPQKASLMRGSLRDNLKFGREEASDKELLEAASLAQAGEVIAGKGGLDGKVEENGRNFSGGQRQRLTVARALARNPEILILDDSSSALDYATDAALRRAIAHLPEKPVTFIVSQRASSVRHADRIIVLEDGRVAGIGSDAELMASCPVYREIVESQSEGRAKENA